MSIDTDAAGINTSTSHDETGTNFPLASLPDHSALAAAVPRLLPYSSEQPAIMNSKKSSIMLSNSNSHDIPERTIIPDKRICTSEVFKDDTSASLLSVEDCCSSSVNSWWNKHKKTKHSRIDIQDKEGEEDNLCRAQGQSITLEGGKLGCSLVYSSLLFPFDFPSSLWRKGTVQIHHVFHAILDSANLSSSTPSPFLPSICSWIHATCKRVILH